MATTNSSGGRGSDGPADRPHRYYGKYRATVLVNFDPEKRGRITARVPDVLGLTPSTWALPCVPITGRNTGSFMVPEVGAAVWIEFEQGDPDYPIWTGGFWGPAAELPELGLGSVPPAHNIVLQTTGRNSLTIMGTPSGGVMLCAGPVASPTSPRIVVTPALIEITNGQASISIAGPTVTINRGALTVT